MGYAEDGGAAGMCGHSFPDEKIFRESDYWIQAEHGIIAMAQMILSYPRKVTVVLTGAQTNLAFCLRMFPHISKKIEKVYS